MPRQLFAGHRVRSLRRTLGINQAALAHDLGISVSYLSQIESGDRPLTPPVLARLAARHPGDWAMVDPSDDDALLVRLIEACADASADDPITNVAEVQRAARQQPLLARRLIALHDAYRRTQAQLRALDERIETAAGAEARLPWEEVRDWFHLQQNYVDAIDRRAEEIAASMQGARTADTIPARLATRFGIAIAALPGDSMMVRQFDATTRTLSLHPGQAPATGLFSIAHQLAQLEFADVIATIAAVATSSLAGRELLSAGLANYAAGALLMPYEAFRVAARETRHDVDMLCQRFGTSFEQTCHRLSTLQRPGAPGIPMFFCRVDMAGNITKRHSATSLQFAQYGGACPLWVVHEAVAIPDRILAQRAETPEGVRYVSMAKGLVKPSGSYARPPRRYAVALGCEEAHAQHFVYADALGTGVAATPIGSSCRICPRRACEQRAFPPHASTITIDQRRRGAIPYSFS